MRRHRNLFGYRTAIWFKAKFPMLYDNFTIPYPEWNHVDFMWAVDTDIYLFPRLLENMGAAEKL